MAYTYNPNNEMNILGVYLTRQYLVITQPLI